MRYYAHYGHREFVLCLGHHGDMLKQALLDDSTILSDDHISDDLPGRICVTSPGIGTYRITFVDTGINASIGERLVAVRPYLQGDEIFLANYADGVTDLPLPTMLDQFVKSDNIASFVSVKPNYSFHVVRSDKDGIVQDIIAANEVGFRMNGGFFIFRDQIFNFIEEGEDLLEEPLMRLVQRGKLASYKHDGFWACMDTFKEKTLLDDIHATGKAPWEVWNRVSKLSVLARDNKLVDR